MGRDKLRKYKQTSALSNVYENKVASEPTLTNWKEEIVHLKGAWNEKHFGGDHPITLELACGRGEYTLALAREYSDRNFVGVDVKGARIWQGANSALSENLSNAAFLRARIEGIEDFFAPNEVSEIWIIFPDPFLKDSKTNRRLTSAPFLKRYASFLQPGAAIHLKTDDPTLYQFTLETIEETGCTLVYRSDDIYNSALYLPELSILTYYERKHLEIGRKIKYIQFKLPSSGIL